MRVGDEEAILEKGGFAFMPSGLPHAFLNLTDEDAEVVVVYTPGGGHHFYEELGPLTRNGTPDRADVAACFERNDMTLLGPPLSDGLPASQRSALSTEHSRERAPGCAEFRHSRDKSALFSRATLA